MAQKELAEKHPDTVEGPPALESVPSRLGFLDSIDMELTHVGYKGVGHVTGGSVSATYGPVTAGVGAGALKLEYFEDPLFYVTPKLEVRGILGDFELYAVGGMPIVPKTGKTVRSVSTYATAGLVSEVMSPEEWKGVTFRLGMEVEESDEWEGNVSKQYLSKMGFGSSVGYGIFNAYVVEEVAFLNQTVYSGRPDIMHHKIRAGVKLDWDKAGAQAEFFQAPFEKGGEMSFTFKTKHVVPTLHGWYSREEGFLGRGNRAGIGLDIAFGAGAINARSHVEVGGGSGSAEGASGIKHRELKLKDDEMGFFKESIRDSKSISEFAAKYRGKSTREILNAASLLGNAGFLNRDADATDEEVGDIGAEGAFLATRKFFMGGGKGGAGVCTNINGAMLGTFLREAGWEAVAVDFTQEAEGHAITLGRDPATGKAYLFDYRGIRVSENGKVWPLLREYAKSYGVIPMDIVIYGRGNKVIGYYEAEEKKLNRAMAGDRETLKEALLHSRPSKK
ncbi:hypothetical protein JW721_01960 [Candidatus Micrarchaeota archaeon]|nr:hypothetical protein [Candidatus Micrarchaeota archaeon]